jgi:hypothetical protein
VKPPQVIRAWITGEAETEDSMREYLKRSAEGFASLQHSDGDLVRWIAFKLSCSRRDAEAAMRWAGIETSTTRGGDDERRLSSVRHS